MGEISAYRLRDVVHRYGDQLALDVPRLDLAASSAYALLGPNGAGKSTLLRILALLLRPSEGRVELLGRAVYQRGRSARWSNGGPDALRRDVTLIHQRPVLFSTTVFRNVSFGLRARGMPREQAAQRVAEILETVGLGGFSDRHARQLSGGEAQRVIIARALVLATPVLLLDEPTSYLDAAARPLLVELIRNRVREGRATVLVATHDEEFAALVSDEQIRLRRGALVAPAAAEGC